MNRDKEITAARRLPYRESEDGSDLLDACEPLFFNTKALDFAKNRGLFIFSNRRYAF